MYPLSPLNIVQSTESSNQNQHSNPRDPLPPFQAKNTENPVRIYLYLYLKVKYLTPPPALIIKNRGFYKPIAKLLFNITRSVMFVTCVVMGIRGINEVTDRIPLVKNNTNFLTLNFWISFFSNFSMAFEQPHRQVDITFFIAPRAFEIYWKSLKNRRFVRDVPL